MSSHHRSRGGGWGHGITFRGMFFLHSPVPNISDSKVVPLSPKYSNGSLWEKVVLLRAWWISFECQRNIFLYSLLLRNQWISWSFTPTWEKHTLFTLSLLWFCQPMWQVLIELRNPPAFSTPKVDTGEEIWKNRDESFGLGGRIGLFGVRVSFCSPGWPRVSQTHSESTPSASWVLGLKLCTTMPVLMELVLNRRRKYIILFQVT